MTEAPLVRLCAAAEVTEDTPAKARIGAEEVAVFRVGEQYYVTQNLCTHGPGELCEGFVQGAEVECPFHQGRFNVITGQPTAAPCTVALRTWKAQLVGDDVLVHPTACSVEPGDR